MNNVSDSSSLLYKFLFHLRGAFSSIKSASQMASQHSEKMPREAIDWFETWMPTIEKWISNEKESHSIFHDGEVHNWEQILQDMAENMKDISVAYAEVKKIELPKSVEGEWMKIIEWVIETATIGCEHLEKVVQSVQSKDYQYLLQS